LRIELVEVFKALKMRQIYFSILLTVFNGVGALYAQSGCSSSCIVNTLTICTIDETNFSLHKKLDVDKYNVNDKFSFLYQDKKEIKYIYIYKIAYIKRFEEKRVISFRTDKGRINLYIRDSMSLLDGNKKHRFILIGLPREKGNYLIDLNKKKEDCFLRTNVIYHVTPEDWEAVRLPRNRRKNKRLIFSKKN